MINREVIERHGCVKELETLDRVLNEKPEQYHEEAMGVLRCLVAIRDHLIEQRRQSPSAELDERLDHFNAVVSVMDEALARGMQLSRRGAPLLAASAGATPIRSTWPRTSFSGKRCGSRQQPSLPVRAALGSFAEPWRQVF